MFIKLFFKPNFGLVFVETKYKEDFFGFKSSVKITVTH